MFLLDTVRLKYVLSVIYHKCVLKLETLSVTHTAGSLSFFRAIPSNSVAQNCSKDQHIENCSGFKKHRTTNIEGVIGKYL